METPNALVFDLDPVEGVGLRECARVALFIIFFFNDTATTEIYTLSLHDALPISSTRSTGTTCRGCATHSTSCASTTRSEEHTSELQSRRDLVCRLLLEKKKT